MENNKGKMPLSAFELVQSLYGKIQVIRIESKFLKNRQKSEKSNRWAEIEEQWVIDLSTTVRANELRDWVLVTKAFWKKHRCL